MVQSKHDERFSSDKISVWGALVIIRRHILFGISAGSVGFFMTGMLTSGTTQEKYSFLHRLITMELYAVVYPAMLVVIIILSVLLLCCCLCYWTTCCCICNASKQAKKE